MEKEKISENYSEEGAYCPSCGRYVGNYDVCPYCGAHVRTRVSLKVLKITAITISIIGLFLLWWVTSQKSVPTLVASEIQPTSNFSYVQMKGVVTKAPAYDSLSQTLSFPIDDGTGRIWIKAYGKQAEEIVSTNKLPKPGDTVSIEGTIRIKGDFKYMIINLPEKLSIKVPEPIELNISELSDSLLGAVVKTSGVVSYVKSYDNLTKIKLCQPEKRKQCIDVTFFYSSFPQYRDSLVFYYGDTVKLTAMLSMYRDRLVLTPRSIEETKVIPGTRKPRKSAKPPENAPKVKISELSKSMLGEFVKVDGVITRIRDIKGGVLVTIDDGTGRMTFPIWQSVLDHIPDKELLAKGATIEFVGKVKEYRGRLEVVPTWGQSVKIKKGEGELTENIAEKIEQETDEEPLLINLLELDRSLLGQKVTVEGEITRIKPIRGGILITIRQGDEYMTTPLWDRVLENSKDADRLKKGAKIRLTGIVKEYRGRLEVVPQKGSDVVVR